MRLGPKYKIARRLGPDVFEKTQTQKFQLSEDRKSKTRKRKRISRSDYNRQLIEKQRVRFTYGMSEKQFSKYVKEAMSSKKMTAIEALYGKLESRLDNVVYRMGLAQTRQFSRQLVSHGHIEVNGKRMSVPSYSVSEGDIIKVRERSIEKGPFQNLEDKLKDTTTPIWLNFNVKEKKGEVKGSPKADSRTSNLDLSVVIEFYSR